MRRVLASLTVLCLSGCGVVFTAPPPEGEDFETPFDDLSPELNRLFLAGDEDFESRFDASTGLGPLFNDDACVSCHPADGPGRPDNILVRFSFGQDLALADGGPQLQDRAVRGAAESLPPDADSSPRRPPAVFGMGLLEAIPEDAILANADPEDADQDGISGRPNWVTGADWVPASEVGGGGGTRLGRFGLKANVASLTEQVVLAYQQDMGVTSDFLPEENHAPTGFAWADDAPDPEIPRSTVENTVVYVRLLQPPARGERTAEVEAGEQLFAEIGCADCHIPTLRTGPNEISVLDEKEVPLYSDLLLHNMGDRLADDRPDGSATGKEWRTTPLWGTRIAGDFNDGPFFLHDGRATTIAEAISFHGGEAAASRENFKALSAADRESLVLFVESL